MKNNIHDRVLKRVENDGMIEARQLYKQYSKLAPQIKSAIGYSQFFDFLQDKITIDELAQEFMKADFNYSKRQMTWFKKDKNIVWFDTTKRGFQEQILSLITHKLDL